MFDNIASDNLGTGISSNGPGLSRKMNPRFQIVWLACVLGALAYTFYSLFTQTGLAGYVMKLEMDIFGSAEETMTMLVTLFGLIIGSLAIIAMVGHFFPALVWTCPDTRTPSQSGVVDRMSRPLGPISWKAVLIIAATPLLAGMVVSAVLYYSARQDQRQKVYPINLASSIAAPPREAKFVEVTGVMARSHALIFKANHNGSVSHELFAPITRPGWTPGEAVQYVVRHEARETWEGQVNWPDAFRHRGAAQFSGKLGRALPPFVTSGFRSKGVKLAPSYSVIEWKELPNHEAPRFSPEAAFIALGIGGAISVFLLPMMMIVKFKHRPRVGAGR